MMQLTTFQLALLSLFTVAVVDCCTHTLYNNTKQIKFYFFSTSFQNIVARDGHYRVYSHHPHDGAEPGTGLP